MNGLSTSDGNSILSRSCNTCILALLFCALSKRLNIAVTCCPNNRLCLLCFSFPPFHPFCTPVFPLCTSLVHHDYFSHKQFIQTSLRLLFCPLAGGCGVEVVLKISPVALFDVVEDLHSSTVGEITNSLKIENTLGPLYCLQEAQHLYATDTCVSTFLQVHFHPCFGYYFEVSSLPVLSLLLLDHPEHLPSGCIKKSCTILHVSCKMCKFLALLILQVKNLARFLHQISCKMKILQVSCTNFCKMKILQVSCTAFLARWKSCKFLAPLFLQDENLASFLHHFSCKMKILQVSYTNVCAKFLQDFVTLTLLWNSFSS